MKTPNVIKEPVVIAVCLPVSHKVCAMYHFYFVVERKIKEKMEKREKERVQVTL